MSKIKRITTTSVNDYKVAVDSSDTNPDYLNDKLNAGDNVTLTAETVDGDKVVTIAAVSTNTTLDSLTDVTGTTTEGQVLTRGSSGYEFEYPKVRTTNTISSTTALTTTTITDYVTLTPAVSTEIRLTLPNASTMPAGSIVEIRFEAPAYTPASSETAAEAEIYADAAVLFHMNADGETAKLIAGASSWSILSRNYPKTSVEETTSGNTTLYIRNESYLHVTHTSSGSETLNIQMPNISETRQIEVYVKATDGDTAVNLKDKTGSTVDSFQVADGAEFKWSLTADDDATGYNYVLTQKKSSSLIELTVDTVLSAPYADKYICQPSSSETTVSVTMPDPIDVEGKVFTFVLREPSSYGSSTDSVYTMRLAAATPGTYLVYENGTGTGLTIAAVAGETLVLIARSDRYEVLSRTYSNAPHYQAITNTETYYWRNAASCHIVATATSASQDLTVLLPAGSNWFNKPIDIFIKASGVGGSWDGIEIKNSGNTTTYYTHPGVSSSDAHHIHIRFPDINDSTVPVVVYTIVVGGA